MTVPAIRVRPANAAPVRGTGYVLYWMVASRRTSFSPALERALEWCRELGLPLVVFEALRADHRYASARFHHFVLDGMADQRARFRAANVRYLPYVESKAGAGRGLLERLATSAAVVVTDDYPTFFLPRMVEAAAARLPARVEAVDGNGLLPLRRPAREYPTARGFRRFVHDSVIEELLRGPAPDPLSSALPMPEAALPDLSPWSFVDDEALAAPERLVRAMPIDQEVARAERGGERAGRLRWRRFVTEGLEGYASGGRHPDDEKTSGISPWLHFGQLSAQELFWDVAAREGWAAGDEAPKPTGKRDGWWRMSADAEAFLEQLTVWRELGYATAAARPDHAEWSILPAWAQRTLEEHASDPREPYALETLERGETSDPIWNAAQHQLVAEGRIHNYLRMLWGKRVLEWSGTPKEALERLLHLNDRWALDGRDPNSYSGITWTLGHFDRAWGPERPIFGKVRYMSSDATRRKLRLSAYLLRWSRP